jgi:hypothetical protein
MLHCKKKIAIRKEMKMEEPKTKYFDWKGKYKARTKRKIAFYFTVKDYTEIISEENKK